MVPLLDIGFQLLQTLLAAHGEKLPAELVQAGQAAVDAWAKHRADVVTKNAVDSAKV